MQVHLRAAVCRQPDGNMNNKIHQLMLQTRVSINSNLQAI